MAAQSDNLQTAAPQTAEEMAREDQAVNPQVEPAQTAPPAAPEPEDEQMDLFDDGRKEIYDRADAHNKAEREAIGDTPLFAREILAEQESQEAPTAEQPQEEPAPTEAPPAQEPPQSKVLSRAEFLEVFKDFRIKDRIAGETVDAGLDEWLTGAGLQRHFTKRLMELSRKEQEILQKAAKVTANVPSEEEVQARHDELYMDSPYKAQQYLKEVERLKQSATTSPEVDETARARAAYDEFVNLYPDLSQEDWARMNDQNFWVKHQDVVDARNNKQWLPVFVMAYNHVQREKLENERASIRDAMAGRTETASEVLARKREGQVIRTAVAPKPERPAPKKQPTNEDLRADYIRQLQKAARERMRIQE